MNGHQLNPAEETLLESVRQALDAVVADLGDEAVPATPQPGYILPLGLEFWNRASEFEAITRRYVDGYWGQCHWNTAMVVVRSAGVIPEIGADFTDLISTSPLKIFQGYAYFYAPGSEYPNGWAEHSWCVDGDVLLESTGPFVAYFGAELTPAERDLLANRVSLYNPIPGNQGLGWGISAAGARIPVTAASVVDSIGLPSTPRPTAEAADDESRG